MKKIFIKIAKALGYEIIDQNNFISPTLNKELNEDLSRINNQSIVLPLGEVKITRKINSLLVIFRTNTSVEIWDQNKKRLFEQPKIEYSLRSLNSLIKSIKYLREKLFAALKIPKAFLGYDENLQGKATLAAEDIRFGRTIDRIQRILLSELYKIALVHLYSQGYRDEQMTNFELDLTTPSIIYDQEKIALMKEKVDLASTMLENKMFPTDWVYENVFPVSY